ncbi:MAG: Fe-S cluster assembly protein SufD [Gammaproteobacteria bacterium]
MNAVAETAQPYVPHFEALQKAERDTTVEWLKALRLRAFRRFAEHGFPAERHEDWKYSNTRALQKLRLHSAVTQPAALDSQWLAPAELQLPGARRLVFVDGVPVANLGTRTQADGLKITPLAQALGDGSGRLEKLLLPEALWADDPFTALNTAFLAHGVLIAIADAAHIAAPLQVLFVSTPQSAPQVSHPRVIVRLGKNARLTLIESHYGLERAANFTNSCTQIDLGAGAALDYLAMQREAAGDFHVSRVYASQHENSRLETHTYNLGGQWVRNDLKISLEAPGASVRMDGLYLVDQHRHVDNHTRIDHLVPHTSSDELYRGIIRERGHAVFNGKVVVAEPAIKTDAIQTNNNLLLTRNGEIDTKPELEIYADDVKCAHGATIGQLDEEALFYLRSRGLDLETARALLTGAFARVITGRIADPKLRQFALAQLAGSLPQLAAEGSA